MAASISSKHKYFIIALITFTVFSCYPGHAEGDQARDLAKALVCLNNQFIYAGCEEAYRLNQMGNVNVPGEATDEFCNGPCLTETKLVLNCIDKTLSNFIFFNKATIKDLRDALYAGCSYTSQRGNFNVGNYIEQGETSNSHQLSPPSTVKLYSFLLIVGCCLSLLYHL